MQFQLSGQHVEVTPALRDHVTAKRDRLARLDDKLLSLAVVLTVDKQQQCAEATLAVTGTILHAEATEVDMYASIDVVFEKLQTQLRKYREKIQDKHQYEVRQERQLG